LRTGVLVASPAVLIAFNMCIFTMLNATAVLFPSWIRLGPGGGGGIELMGQAMIMVLGVFIAVGIFLLVPAFAIGTIGSYVEPAGLTFGLTLVLAAGLLALETYGLIALLGRSFDRAEPTHVMQ
jgi:hypothetical protein